MPAHHVVVLEVVAVNQAVKNHVLQPGNLFLDLPDTAGNAGGGILLHQRVKILDQFVRRALVFVAQVQGVVDTGEQFLGAQAGRGKRLHGGVALQTVQHRFRNDDVTVLVDAQIASLPEPLHFVVVGEEPQIVQAEGIRHIASFNAIAGGTPHDGGQDNHLHGAHVKSLCQRANVGLSQRHPANGHLAGVFVRAHLLCDAAHPFNNRLAHNS